MKNTVGAIFVAWTLVSCSPEQQIVEAPAEAPRMKMTTEIPESITTPDSVETRIGRLEFSDGAPSVATTMAVYDNLDFQRGVRTFLDAMPIASLYGMREGLREAGMVNGVVGIFEELMDSKTLFLTANTESVYAFTWLDLKDGPMVVESPPQTLGIVDDFFFNHVADLGNAGPDRGQGGKFLFLPPGYDGEVPDGYFTFRSLTYGNWLLWRGFQIDGDAKPAVANIKANTRIYPLAQRANPPEQKFVNVSGQYFNTIHANDFTFFEEVSRVIEEEPVESLNPEFLGLLASIGIKKGKPFAPDARMKQILTDAVAVGNATARAILFATRDPESYLFENSAWKTGFIGGSHEFLRDGARLLDARTLFFYYATGITPAMAIKMIGVGSQYAGAGVAADGARLDGGRTYRLRLPPRVPVKDFWSLVLYDNQTRSMLQTNQQFPSLNSQRGVEPNADGSTDIYFGPNPPDGMESNWIQTVPGKGWTVVLRLYGPLEPWFDKQWQPGEIEHMKDIPTVEPMGERPFMATDIPASIRTPDRIETRIGTLEFVDGFPTEATVDLVYDNLDFMRGVEVFLNAIPPASLVAMRAGLRDVGAVDGTVSIFESLLDSRSLFLTPNSESIYAGTWLDLSAGPIVVHSPPNTLGIVNDFWFRYVADLGNAGPDRGQGGKFLFLPPDYDGEEPEGYFVYRSPTNNVLLMWRGFLVDGDPGPGVANIKQHARVYPLSMADNPPEQRFVNVSGQEVNTIHANDFSFYEEVNEMIQEEPSEAGDVETLGLFASIGIVKGQPFAPDARMKQILTEAAAVGNATARAQLFAVRQSEAKIYRDGAWFNPFIGGSHEWLADGVRLLDARSMFFYYATMVTPAMTMKMIGVGSQYAVATRDANGVYLDGSKSYRLRLPPGVPAKDFWSFVVYDNQTRSMLQTDQRFPSVNSQRGVQANSDGSYDIYFAPEAPVGKESNWVQTVPGKGWNTILRLYGPMESWFDQTWRPGEIELLN